MHFLKFPGWILQESVFKALILSDVQVFLAIFFYDERGIY